MYIGPHTEEAMRRPTLVAPLLLRQYSTPIMRLHRQTDGQTRARCFTLSGVVMASVKQI